MRYVSTRGEAPALLFEGALLAGLARDGGLYLPEAWPKLSAGEIAALAGLDYADAAYRVMAPYLKDDPALADLQAVLEEAYDSFHHPAVAPLRQIAPGAWLLELFHGPTLAFKDLAMQVVARLMNRALHRRGARATVVGATSGDTGAAAIEAFRGLDAIDVFILHPKGRVSDVQRRQMTTATEPNVHNIAIEGTFDDCQAVLKALFNDPELRDRLELTGINSINWARIFAQIVYYFTAAWPSARRTAPLPSPCPPEISVIFSQVTPPARWACRSNASLLPRTSMTVSPAPSPRGSTSQGAWSPRPVRAWTSSLRAISSACCSSSLAATHHG